MSDAESRQPGCGLGERDRAMLDFEATWDDSRGPKSDQIRDRFGLSTPRYYQVLNALIDRPEALAYAPALVQRLLRLRGQRRSARSAGQVAPLR